MSDPKEVPEAIPNHKLMEAIGDYFKLVETKGYESAWAASHLIRAIGTAAKLPIFSRVVAEIANYLGAAHRIDEDSFARLTVVEVMRPPAALVAWANARVRHKALKSDPRVNSQTGRTLYDAQLALEALADTLAEAQDGNPPT